ncbi:hypothetical protein LCGC14_0351430 [marine sediment metagenome]|uniref:Uncharacterized protein n=1 Tax=marine sediment metagenome TaxID=412755 RepID=A0A0F9TG98_9ZZZZ
MNKYLKIALWVVGTITVMVILFMIIIEGCVDLAFQVFSGKQSN